MSERPRFKDDIGNVSYRSGWNACIDAWEAWEKSRTIASDRPQIHVYIMPETSPGSGTKISCPCPKCSPRY